jgi:alpha-1,6-mannosyltransferase
MSAQRRLGARHHAVGATETGSVGFGSDALRVGAPALLRSSKVGLLALTGLAASMAVLVVTAAGTNVLLPESIRPIPPTGTLHQLAGPFGAVGINLRSGGLVAVMLAMFLCYVVTVLTAEHISGRAVLLCIAFVNVIVLLAPPLFSTDIFSYQMYARMGAVFGFNPYLVGPHASMLDQPFYSLVGAKWAYTPSVYGPLFTAMSYLFSHFSVAAATLAYRTIAVVSSLGTVALVWSAARLRGMNQARAVALVGLNPLTVVFGVGGGHNDLLMLLALMAGVWYLLTRRERPSGAMMVVATAVKLSAVLPMLFAAISGDAHHGGRIRRGFVVGALGATAAIVAVSFGLFGTGPLHLPVTLENVQSVGDWHSVPGLLRALQFPTASAVISVALGGVFVAVVVWLAYRVWEGKMDWVTATGWMTAALLVTTSSFLPWYVAWLMPFTALVADRRLWRFSLGVTGFFLVLQLFDYIPAAKQLIGV